MPSPIYSFAHRLRRRISAPSFEIMAELDESQEAVRNVDRITDSEPVNGEELLRSEKLKRQLREAKERLKSESADKPRK